MLEKSNGKVGTRELFALVFVMIAIKGMDMTPVNLFHSGKNATWMFPLIWLVVMAVPFIALLSILKKYKDKHIIDIIYKLTGKYIGFFINLVFLLAILSASVTNSRGYVDVLSSRYMALTPTVVLYGSLLFTSYFIANRGFEAISRTAFVIIPYTLIGILLLQILIWKDMNTYYLFPILGPGVKDIIVHSTMNSSLIGEYMLFAVFYPYVKDHQTFKKAISLGFIVSSFFISLLLAEYIMVFDYIGPTKMLHAFSQLTRLTEITIFINNLDAVYLLLWIIIGIVRFAFYLYGTAAVFAYTFKMKEFEPLILPISLLVLSLGIIPKNPSITILVLRENYLLSQSWLFFFSIPIILWIISKFKDVILDEEI